MKLLTSSQKRKLVDWIAGKLGVYHSYADEPIYVIKENRLGHIIVRYSAEIPVDMSPPRAKRLMLEGLMAELIRNNSLIFTEQSNSEDINKMQTVTLNVLIDKRKPPTTYGTETL